MARRTALRGAVVLGAGSALAGGAVLAGGACNLLLGTSAFTACSSVGDAGWYAGDCLSCVEAHCCDEAAACAADSACSMRQACLSSFPLLSCPLAGGVEATAGKQASTTGATAALERCVAASCGACRGPWACVGFPAWPSTGPDAGATVTLDPSLFTGTLCERGPSVRIARVSVCSGPTSCKVFDNAAAAPPGPFAVPVPLQFTGYLDVVPDPLGGDSDPLESLVYLTWPMAGDTRVDLRFVTADLLHSVADAGAVQTFDADAGTLVVLARDCLGDPAAGVTLASWKYLTPNTFAGSDGFRVEACSPPSQAGAQLPDAAPVVTTADDGVAGWALMQTGTNASFTATLDGGLQIASWVPLLQPKTVTYVWMTPTTPASQLQQ